MRTLETFQGTVILGASRGHLCDSSAVLFIFLAGNMQKRLARGTDVISLIFAIHLVLLVLVLVGAISN